MSPDAFERLRERLAHVDADQGWFFAQVAEQVIKERKALGLSQKELAELTGTTLFTVSRILTGWEAEGLVRSGRAHIEVTDPHALRDAAEGDAE